MRESTGGALIEAHLAERDIAATLREYDAFRQLPHDELGLDPSEELRALVEGLR